jgi:hypothetical protein
VTARIIFFVNPEIDLLKATFKKEMWIPGYTKHDGTSVEGHYKHVNVADDHDDAKVLSGNGSATQKDAHKLLTKHGFYGLPQEHHLPVLLAHATDMQDAAGIRARAAKFRVAILGGAMPIPSQTKAYLLLDADKQAKYKAEFEKAGKLDLFEQAIAEGKAAPDEPGEAPQKPAEAAAAPAPEAVQPEAPASAPEAAQEPAFKPLDHGELNIPGKTKNIDAELDKYKKQQAADAKAKAKTASAEKKENKAKAKALFDEYIDAIKAKHGAKYGAKEVENMLDGWVKWEPKKAIQFIEQFVKEQGATYEAAAPEVAPEPTPVQQAAPKSDEAKEKAEKLTSMVADLKGMEFPAMDELADSLPGKASWFMSGIAQANDDWIKEGQAAWDALAPEQKAASLSLLEASIKHDAEYDAKHAEKLTDDKLTAVAHKLSILNGLKKQWLVPAITKETIDDAAANGDVQTLQQLASIFEGKEQLGSLSYVKQALAQAQAGKEEPKAEVPAAASSEPVKPVLPGNAHHLWFDEVEEAYKAGDAESLENLAHAFGVDDEAAAKAITGYAKACIAALEAKSAPTAASSASVKPTMPDFGGSLVSGGIAKKIAAEMEAGNVQGLQDQLYMIGNPNPGSQFATLKKYAEDALAYVNGGGAAADDGPKEGDTKVIDGVTYELKGGRWHKVGGAETASDTVGMPVFAGKTIEYYSKVAAKLKALFDKGDWDGIQKMMDGDGKTWAGTSPNSKLLIQYGKELLGAHAAHGDAAPVEQAAPEPALQAAPEPDADEPEADPSKPESIDGWHQTGGQKGSNAGGEFTDEHGQKWYCKFPASESHTKNEMLAAKLYEAAGIEVPHLKLVTQGGKVGIASKIIDGVKKDSSALAAGVPGVADGFAVDAWLANWDVVGTGYDNMQIKPNGHAVRLDVGGSLLYRAQGTPKGDEFGNTVGELQTLKNGKNGYAAHAFGKLTDAQIAESAKKVSAVSPETIQKLVMEYGPGSHDAKLTLAAKLIARREDVLKQTGASAPKPGIASAVEKPAESAPQPAAAAPAPSGELAIPEFDGPKAAGYASAAKKLMETAAAQGNTKHLHKLMGGKKHLLYGPSLYSPGKYVKIATIMEPAKTPNGAKLLEFWQQLEAKYAGPNKKKSPPKVVAAKETSAAPAPAQAAPAEPAKPDLRNLAIDTNKLPKLTDFHGGNGGSGISSKAHVNDANAKDQKDVLNFALKGDLIALRKYEYEAFDKQTGASLGMKPITDHPSKHVKEFWEACCSTLELVAFPPAPLKAFDEHVSDDVKALSDSFKPHLYGKSVHNVAANEKLGFWIALGVESGWKKFKPQQMQNAVDVPGIKEKGHALFAKYTANVKHFIKSVQATGSYNNAYREGKDVDSYGKATRPILYDLYGAAQTKPAGTTITKWMSMPDEMIDQFMSAPDGLVFQNPGSMCCSMHPTGTKGFGSNKMTIHYAPGAKAIDTFGSGGFAGEMEITTLPGTRFMVLSKKKTSDGNLHLEVLMLPPDQTYIDNILTK